MAKAKLLRFPGFQSPDNGEVLRNNAEIIDIRRVRPAIIGPAVNTLKSTLNTLIAQTAVTADLRLQPTGQIDTNFDADRAQLEHQARVRVEQLAPVVTLPTHESALHDLQPDQEAKIIQLRPSLQDTREAA
jgi:hypothetical protein